VDWQTSIVFLTSLRMLKTSSNYEENMQNHNMEPGGDRGRGETVVKTTGTSTDRTSMLLWWVFLKLIQYYSSKASNRQVSAGSFHSCFEEGTNCAAPAQWRSSHVRALMLRYGWNIQTSN